MHNMCDTYFIDIIIGNHFGGTSKRTKFSVV